MRIIYVTLAWCLGIISAYYLETHVNIGLIYTLSAVVALWTAILLTNDHAQLRFVAILVCCFLIGGLWLDFRSIPKSEAPLPPHHGKYVKLVGTVAKEPLQYDRFTQVQLDVEGIWVDGRVTFGKEDVLLTVRPHEDIQYGDRILVRGEIFAPPRLDEFSYRDYLARQGIFTTMSTSYVRVIEREQGSSLRQRLIQIKSDAQQNIQDALPEPQAGLLTGILLGDETGLASNVRADFDETGTSHIIAISGFNMTIISAVVIGILLALFRKRTPAVLLSLVVIGLYTVLVGANAAVLRAALMSGVFIFGKVVKRKGYLPATLAFAVLIMTIFSPVILWDIGFQLSFAAVLGMMLLVPPMERPFRQFWERAIGQNWGKTFSDFLAEPVIVTLAAQIATLPIILTYFGQFSLISIIANFLIIPVQSVILVLGGIGVLLSLISPALGSPFFLADWLFLTYTIEIVRSLAEITTPLAFDLPAYVTLGILGLVLIYILGNATRAQWLADIKTDGKNMLVRQSMRSIPLFVGLVVLGILGQNIINQPDDNLHVVYMDMGHSQSVLIRTPDGVVMMIDGGDLPSQLLAELGDQLPPNKREIDVWFLTSDASNNIESMLTVIDRYTIQTVLMSPTLQGDVLGEIKDKLVEKEIPIIESEAGQIIETSDGVSVQVLAPHTEVDDMVLRLTYHDAVFLFPGAISRSEERELLQQPHLIQANVMLAINHASENTNSQQWVDIVNPQIVIIQSDPASRFNVTSRNIVDHFTERKLYRTDQHGRIEIITNGQELNILTER